MTSLSLFPRALALSAYSAVSGSRMTLCLAISCSALFACRSPPLLSVSVNLFFTSFAKQARRSRKGGFTGCANVISPIPVTT